MLCKSGVGCMRPEFDRCCSPIYKCTGLYTSASITSRGVVACMGSHKDIESPNHQIIGQRKLICLGLPKNDCKGQAGKFSSTQALWAKQLLLRNQK